MYPTDPVSTAKHIRLMTELKELFVQGYLNSDLKRAIRQRLDNIHRRIIVQKPTAIEPEPIPNYFSDHRIAVYTAVFGPVDEIREPIFTPDNCDFFIFTDQPMSETSAWTRQPMQNMPIEIRQDNILMSRYVKMFPDRFFPDYDFTIYVDGKYQVRTDLTEFIQDMNPIGLRMFKHPLRTSVYQEIEACIQHHKGSKPDLLAYSKRLKQAQMPDHYGLLEGGVIVRETHNAQCQTIMQQWWEEFRQYVKRDQLSLPYVLWMNNVQIEQVGQLGETIWSHPAIRKFPHRRGKPVIINPTYTTEREKQ